MIGIGLAHYLMYVRVRYNMQMYKKVLQRPRKKAKKFVSASYGKAATKTTLRNDCNEKMGTPNIQNLQPARFQTVTQPNTDYRGNKEVTSEVTPEATRQMHRVRHVVLGVMLPLCYLFVTSHVTS